MLLRAAAVRADEPDRVRVVDHDHRVVAIGELNDLWQWRHVAVHREDPVGDHHPKARVGALLQLLLQVGHVPVGVPVSLRFAQPDAVDDARVVECVRDDGVALVEQCLEDASVRVEA